MYCISCVLTTFLLNENDDDVTCLFFSLVCCCCIPFTQRAADVMYCALLCECFSDVYLNKKLELDKAEADITEFINTTLSSVTFMTVIFMRQTVILVTSFSL